MKRRQIIISLLSIFLLFQFSLVRSQENHDEETRRVNYNNPETWLLGYFTHDAMLIEPHNIWYNSGFDSYSFDDKAFVELSEISADDITITIVLGTWCPDSRRELPHFMKIIESWGFPGSELTLIGVDSYKVAPIENYDDLGIDRVPTFIIYRNKIEIGRIIEYPKASLERDMVNILKNEDN
jgi:thiol-disulfide isomerase/thioredoxin